MGFVKTAAKIALGYAAARGVDRMSGGQGLGALVRQVGGRTGSAPSSLPSQGGMSGLLGSLPSGSSGLAGMLTAGGAAAAGAGGLSELLDRHAGPTAEETAEANAKLMLRAMIQAAKADGHIDAAEKQKLMQAAGDATAEELAFIEEQLAAPVNPRALAADTPPDQAEDVYVAALMTIAVDHPAELDFLRDLGQALGLPEHRRAAMHNQIGAPSLPV